MRRKPLSDEIREAVRRSGRTNYDIARQMRVAPPTIWRFTNGQSGLSLALLDRLAEAIDLHIVVGKQRRV
jgi:plasmid maintenance system antidote protein VapI